MATRCCNKKTPYICDNVYSNILGTELEGKNALNNETQSVYPIYCIIAWVANKKSSQPFSPTKARRGKCFVSPTTLAKPAIYKNECCCKLVRSAHCSSSSEML